ncbi:flavin-containing monooxygenase FMO GS-OX-like 4 isoform X1 [Triticum dicoccoides]|uniref:flavin-containing monooxygenase FMO GS-OX-like 4 isoform X1 n=1 Tax=Triticum dicoccoides TaxID=85692 RepID=UPI00188E4356|nr:flavin-containing monooxygenase FMO GS-OX-like 4 isoform X1 [Triticum dicoccoides]
MPSRRVAVIGAGAAGLVAARELLREGHAPVVFERAAGVGGTWLYDDEASADPLGAGGVHGSLYASLRTNLPRESMGFLDFPFVADEDSVDPRRFPGHQEVLRYLEAFARRFDLLGLVRLETEVVSVRRGGDASWSVSYCSRKLAGAGSDLEEEQSEVFDAVVVCNGHFAEPRLADIAGIDGWPGKQLHSHSYRVPDQFRGQVVVIIGYNPSGMDISRDIAGVAKEVHVAIRAAPAEMESTTAHAIANLWLHPMIHRAEEDGSMVFQDGSRVRADAIVHCTGYKYNFPFLGDDDGGDSVITVDDNRVDPLYKHVFPPRLAPRISFVGLPFKAIPFLVFQLQSSWVAGVLSGRIELPSPEEMMQDVAAFYTDMEARGRPKRFTHDLGAGTFEYEDWLVERCGLESIEEWRRVIYVTARGRIRDRPESYRDEWDDDAQLLEQAHRDLGKYL